MAKLSYKRRQKLPDKEFALKNERKYPIDTRKRARNALARVSQFGNETEIKRVRRAVHRKYPSIRITPRINKLR